MTCSRDAIREGRIIKYTKTVKRKIILNGSATKGHPLHRACAANSVACVRLLIDSHAPIECLDSNRATPLIVAAGHSSLQVLTLLLHVGASSYSCDKSGRTPLHWAAAKGNLPFVLALLPDSNVNARDERGCTPLHLAGGERVCVCACVCVCVCMCVYVCVCMRV